jgi:prepilin-type N-terminal cleavage/methylation domain-containing protein
MKIKQKNTKNNKTAYSLLELSIVILIIAILISGAMSMSVGTLNNAKNKATQDKIAEIYKAIGNFLLANRRLPCPASLKKIRNTDADYGSEVVNCSGPGVYQSSTSTNLIYGAVPVKALGLSNDMAEDAFENKIVYMIDKRFGIAADVVLNISNITFATSASTNIITVKEKPAGVEQVASIDAILLLISQGANKSGAFNNNNNTQNTRSTDAAELNNDITAFIDGTPSTATFDNIIMASSDNSEIFDDIVFFKTRNQIVNNFNAMFLIPCLSAGINFGNVSAYYGTTVYATASCLTPNEDKRLTRKCEAFGNWVDLVRACP